jgi:hypothetical protein
MAGNSRPSFSKRQKERARQEKQAEKMRIRAEKKLNKPAETVTSGGKPELRHDEEGNPVGLEFHDF